MIKIKISAFISLILGIISLLWIIYDYIALTDAVYQYGEDLIEQWRIVSYGFIPIILFHISVFITISLIFTFMKTQKEVLKEYKILKADSKHKDEIQNKTIENLKDKKE